MQKTQKKEARSALSKISNELKLINESAVSSLEEGLEETLTVTKLNVPDKLKKSLKTTNCIENVNSLIGQYTDRVDYWKNSNQRQRWVASALTRNRTKTAQTGRKITLTKTTK